MTQFYCISLEERSDRRERLKEIIQKLDIPLEWWIVKKHPDGGIYGCFESHIAIWNKMAKSNYPDDELVVIMEDDLCITEPVTSKEFYTLLKKCRQLLKENKVDIIHLGHLTQTLVGKIHSSTRWSFFRGKCTFAHLYAITVGKIREHINTIKRGYGQHIDIVMCQKLQQILLLPNVFQQRDLLDTDNQWDNDADQFYRDLAIIRNKHLPALLTTFH